MSLANQIRQIFLQDWDPVGIKHVPQAQDEYDSYLANITRLVQSQAAKNDIAAALLRAEVDMGLGTNENRANLVAAKLLLIYSSQ